MRPSRPKKPPQFESFAIDILNENPDVKLQFALEKRGKILKEYRHELDLYRKELAQWIDSVSDKLSEQDIEVLLREAKQSTLNRLSISPK